MKNARDSAMRSVRGIMIAQLDKSSLELRKRAASDGIVHEVRNELKRARASLRFLRECVGESAFHRENRFIRDAARPLRSVRDAKVLVHAFTETRGDAGDGAAEAFRVRVMRELQRERRESRGRPEDGVRAAVAIGDVRRRIAGIPAAQLDRVAVSAGVKRVYKSGLKALAKVRQEATDERLHEWRKQVKYLFHQIDILSGLSAGHFAKIRQRSRRLAALLGQDHDLAVLQQKVGQISRAAGLTDDSSALRDWSDGVGRRRAALQRKAHRLGGRLYSKRPRQIAGKIDKCL
ncbi:MAG TPA: CHAD domain-containing protein [Steroidobacteraceae bacterium]|nr:CHAD domain-containing protein [Steroidobacteraceae bacterium]